MTTAIFKYFGLPGRTEQKITGKTKKDKKRERRKIRILSVCHIRYFALAVWARTAEYQDVQK